LVWTRYRKIVLLTAVFSALVILSGLKIRDYLANRIPTYVFGVVAESELKERLPLKIQTLISQGLTRFDETGKSVPGLASGWEINEDGDEYRFRLRRNLTWTNGTKVKASQLKFDIPGAVIETPDEETIVFKLKNPYSPFPTVVAKPLLLDHLLGVGPYRVVSQSRVKGVFESVTLELNRARFKIKFYPNDDLARTALKLGEVDGLVGIRDPGGLISWPSLTVITYFPRNRFVGIFYNNRDQLLSEKDVRRALTFAIPHEFPGKAIDSPIDAHSWAYNPHLKKYDFDFKKAEELLESSPSAKLTLTTLPTYASLGKKIVESWKRLGLAANLNVTASITPGQVNFQALLIGQKVPEDPDQYSLWHSTQATNITGYMSPRVDKLLEDARQTRDLDQRKELYFDFQRFLTEDAPAAFLYQPEEYVFLTKRAKTKKVEQFVGDLISEAAPN
jgi:peptide/nickel transport system substrate-binding protein